MAITGEGTQDNPYIVHTIAEFREKAAEADCYIKLANDLDCNKDKYLSWETLDVACVDIDLNEFSIKSPYIEGANLFMRFLTVCSVHNGAIMGMYLASNTSQSMFLKTSTFDHVAMDINVSDGSSSTIFYSSYWDGFVQLNFCNIKFVNNSVSAQLFYDGHRSESYWYAKNSLFTVTNTKASHVGSGATEWYSEGYIQDSRFEVVYTTNIPTDYIFSKITIMDNCIFNLNVNAVEKPENIPSMCREVRSGIYNTDKAKFLNGEDGLNFGTAIGCADTDDEIKNPDYNNSIGFTVIKVD